MAKKQTPEWLKEGPGYVDITLSRETTIGGAKMKVVRMREPTVGDQEVMMEMEGSDTAKEIHIAANLCDMSPDDIRKLPLRDWKRINTAYAGFID
jgi:hypothetical protein